MSVHAEGQGQFESPQDIATALRLVADRLEALPRVAIPNTGVYVRLHTHNHVYDDASGAIRDFSAVEVIEAVDLLSFALSGNTGAFDPDAPTHYLLPHDTCRDGVHVGAVTIVNHAETAAADCGEAWS